MKDLLGYAGGVNNSIGVMENLFNVDVNYFLKVNTHSIIGLVDTLGGLEFCSDKSFTTTHALITDTYDDTKGPKLNVKKGCHTYSGIEILTISRERKAYSDGDRQRQKNCQAIMISLFKKMASLNSLTNFSNVLNKVSELYSTNIPQNLVTEIAKSAIDGNTWTFDQQSVTGSDSSDFVHLGTVKDYVMRPNQDSVSNASAKMKSVMYES
jgi:LCP family protein required for cell wall assembly